MLYALAKAGGAFSARRVAMPALNRGGALVQEQVNCWHTRVSQPRRCKARFLIGAAVCLKKNSMKAVPNAARKSGKHAPNAARKSGKRRAL